MQKVPVVTTVINIFYEAYVNFQNINSSPNKTQYIQNWLDF